MININKKIVYLSAFLVLALFVISACEDIKGARLKRPIVDEPMINGIHVGDVIKISNIELKLVNVGSGGDIIVEFNGIQEVILADSTKIINDIKIKNIWTFYSDNLERRAAELFY